jgi:hypothetical protein
MSKIAVSDVRWTSYSIRLFLDFLEEKKHLSAFFLKHPKNFFNFLHEYVLASSAEENNSKTKFILI